MVPTRSPASRAKARKQKKQQKAIPRPIFFTLSSFNVRATLTFLKTST